MNDRSEIEWAPRVSLFKIRELYINEARGTCSDEILNEVGFGLFARCASILEFSEALDGQVRCKRCAREGSTTILERKTKKPEELLRCPNCAWQVRWRVYLAESEKVDGQLNSGHAGAAFRKYTAIYPQCRSAEEKMLAIDRLIHEFHWILIEAGKDPVPHKPAGVNLLRGSATQVIDLLNELTYGENTPAELLEGRDWWLAQKPIARRLK
jgi:hypothetical protein